MSKDEYVAPVITIDYRRFLELKLAEEKLMEGSTISGLTQEEFLVANTQLVIKALTEPELFRNSPKEGIMLSTGIGKFRARIVNVAVPGGMSNQSFTIEKVM